MEKMALEYVKEQVKDNQMNWNYQHFQLREQFVQRHGNLREYVFHRQKIVM